MTSLRRLEEHYQAALYRLLPGLYRSRDEHGELERFLALFGHEFARLTANIERLGDDFYIDSCQDWVIPYIADLLDTDIVFNQGARNRADVKNTMKWRRQKGTLAGLEDIAAEIGGWGAHAVEMLDRLVWTQNLNHLRPQPIHAVNLADGSRLARLRTPFDLACRSVDFRPPQGMTGAYQIANVAFSYWPIPSQPVVGADPVGAGQRRYFFDPLGRNQILHAGGDATAACANGDSDPAHRADICFPHVDHVPIRGRDFRDNPTRYFGVPSGFTVEEDGISLCATAATAPSQSTAASLDFAELAALDGMRMADQSLFGGPPKRFRITALRLASKTTTVNGQLVPVSGSPAGPFSGNYQTDGPQGDLDTTAFTYSKGLPYQSGTPAFHQPFLTLRIERLAADANFPECELLLRSATGRALLVYLPAFAGLGAGQQLHFYVADDGSTYFARGTHDAGEIDLNPNSEFFGAFLPRHLARASAGQARPRPGRPMAFRRAVYRPLCCWDQPLQVPPKAGEVAFDPERGRFMFPAGEEPTGKLTASFRFAITGELGAGPYFRGDPVPATLTVAKVADAPHRTIQAAINAAPAGGSTPVVIEILDSHTYAESVTVNKNLPGGLVIRAAALQMPLLRPPAGAALQITGPAGPVLLDGIVIAGGLVTITGAAPDVTMRYCSLDPATSGISVTPAVSGGRVSLANSISGPISAAANVGSLALTDSVVQHVAGGAAITAVHALSIERVTVAGATAAGAVDVSNSILFGALTVADLASGGLRYSRHEKNPPALRRFRCTTAFPIFASLRFGHPGYSHVTPNSAAALRTGAENGGEMGAFYRAGVGWREQNVETKIGQYIPAGLRPVPVRILPSSRVA